MTPLSINMIFFVISNAVKESKLLQINYLDSFTSLPMTHCVFSEAMI